MGSNRREGFEPEILDDDDMFAGIDSLKSAVPSPEEQSTHPMMVCDKCGRGEGQCLHVDFGSGNSQYRVIPQDEYYSTQQATVEPSEEKATPELDKSGYPWDERIHGAAKNINKDGTWRLIRGIDKGLVAQVQAEYDSQKESSTGSTGAIIDDFWVCEQCGIPGGACGHNENGQFGVIRASEFKAAPHAAEETPTEAPPKPTAVTADLVIAKFIETRDEIAELTKKHKAALAGLNDVQEKRSMWLSGELQRQGLTSFKTGAGICFVDKKDSATVADGAAFMKWVGSDFEKNKHFLENKVSKTAVKQCLDDGKLAPPGVNYTTIQDVKIRRA